MLIYSARSGSIIGIFSIFFNMQVFCVFSLESTHQGDSNEYTQYTIFNQKKNNKISPQTAAMGFFQGTLKRVRNRHGKRAISVRATEFYYTLYLRLKGRFL